MRPDPLDNLSDAALLRLRIRDLPFLRDGRAQARFAPYIEQLHAELAEAGLHHLRPTVYLGDEWFSPEGVASIAVPFYLAHPRLRELERRMMATVEGGTPAWLRKLLRHEAGHCFDHAYEVSRTRDWRQIFGAPPRRYQPDVYVPDPRSRDHVVHLDGFYAQAHPDEDFAETFAVLVTPGLDWRAKYRNRPGALRKLEYVQALIDTHGPRKPRAGDGPACFQAARMRTTLAAYYARRRAEAAAHKAKVARMTRDSELH